MLHVGENTFEGVRVCVERKRVGRISIRVGADAVVRLSVPKWGATLRSAEEFLRSKWRWVEKARAEMARRVPENVSPVTDDERTRLSILLDELNEKWAARFSEGGVTWTLRRMSSLWGSCHVQRRRITYALSLARVPERLVEYIVVHELTHLKVSSHGAAFCRLMDERLPDWRARRRELNKRGFAEKEPESPSRGKLVQGEFWDVL